MKGKRGERPAAGAPVDETSAPDPDMKAEETPAGSTTGSAGSASGSTTGSTPIDTTIKTYEKILVTESVKHTFTQSELAELADKMAQAAANVYRIEREKSEQAAHFGAELKSANLIAGEFVAKYNLRYEMRDVECRIEFDTPEPGYKSYIRTDNGETVKEAPMTPAERQRAFVFDAGDGRPQ